MNATGEKLAQQKPQKLQFVALNKATLTDNALLYEQAPTFEEWQAHGQALQKCSGAALWWVGDWFVWGEQQFGEKAFQAVGDYNGETIRMAVWVSSRVCLANRKQQLGHKHHMIVAALSSDEQVKWLKLAVDHDLTTRELSASIKAGKVVTQQEIDAQRQLSAPITDVALVFHSPVWERFKKQQWAERDKLPLEQKRAWLAVLREPVEMYEALKSELGVVS